jgi:RNA polymerase sigma-70 factor (ECF subfamily)
VTAYLKQHSFKGESKIESWLRGIAHNHLRNFIRKKREKAVGGSAEIQAILEESCDHWENHRPVDATRDALAECMRRLPEFSSDLLKQRYALGKSVREIGKETGKGYSALTMQFHRLRELLAECIERKLSGEKS